MSKKFGILIFLVTILSLVVIFLLTATDILKKDNKNTSNTNEASNNELNNNEINNIDKNIFQRDEIVGNYKVRNDEKSILNIKENGEYNLNINMCEGYLNLTGKYEIVDKKLKLLNDIDFENYPTLHENYEFSFTIIDNNTIRLDEDLICLFQNTLFER